jgi:hypothetical protein
MEMENMLQMIKHMMTSQEEAEARQEMANAELKADINANITASQEKANAELKARLDQFNEEVKAHQDRADAKIEACLERMEAAMRSMQSDIEQSVQKQVEDVLSVMDHKTHSLQLDLTEKIESTQVKLDTIEMSLGVETDNLRLDLSNMQAETISKRQTTFERIEAVRREFHTRLEEAKEMAGHARGTGNSTCAVTPPKFDGTTSWSVFRHQFETIADHN